MSIPRARVKPATRYYRGMLSVLTWNVWFGGHRFDERCPALVERCYRADADLIALQEVTPELFEHLRAAPWLRDYQLSDPDGSTLGDYGVLILSRHPLHSIELHPLPTRMGRSLLVADVAGPDEPVSFATAHLESQDDAALRAQQLGIVSRHLARRHPRCLLVGDMNFADAAEPETSSLDPAFRDVWSVLHPGEAGYTVDTDVNLMRWQVKEKVTRKRIDRVFARGGLLPTSIRLFGDRCVGGDPELFASDHFGLHATFDYQRSS